MTESRREKLEFALNRRQPDLTVLLENVFDPHNISAIMRTADAVGIAEIYVLNTVEPPKNYWAYRSARSAEKWVGVKEYTDFDQCLSDIKQTYHRLLGTYVSNVSGSIFEQDFTKPSAIVFGNEKYGLSKKMLSVCDDLFQIPQMGMVVSLNISVACAVCLYEALRQRTIAAMYAERRISTEMYDSLWESWSQPWLTKKNTDNN